MGQKTTIDLDITSHSGGVEIWAEIVPAHHLERPELVGRVTAYFRDDIARLVDSNSTSDLKLCCRAASLPERRTLSFHGQGC
jgi:hypothetical protein